MNWQIFNLINTHVTTKKTKKRKCGFSFNFRLLAPGHPFPRDFSDYLDQGGHMLQMYIFLKSFESVMEFSIVSSIK